MKRFIIILILSFTLSSFYLNECLCDIDYVEKYILNLEFKTSVPTNPKYLNISNFNNLDEKQNQSLWYDEIQYPKKTPYTSLWDDYSHKNYHASHHDFISYFKNKPNIELAFQFGPNFDLWAYHIFTIKKYECCFIITRSYFRHNRFTSKQYSIINLSQVDSLHTILERIPKKIISSEQIASGNGKYQGFFQDNRHNQSFYVNFYSEKDSTIIGTEDIEPMKGIKWTKNVYEYKTKKVVTELYDLVDNEIKWKDSYTP